MLDPNRCFYACIWIIYGGVLFMCVIFLTSVVGCQDHKKAAPERELTGSVKLHSIHFSHVYDHGRQLSAYHAVLEFADSSTAVTLVYSAKIQADVPEGRSLYLDVIGKEPGSVPFTPIVVLHVHSIDDIKFTSKK